MQVPRNFSEILGSRWLPTEFVLLAFDLHLFHLSFKGCPTALYLRVPRLLFHLLSFDFTLIYHLIWSVSSPFLSNVRTHQSGPLGAREARPLPSLRTSEERAFALSFWLISTSDLPVRTSKAFTSTLCSSILLLCCFAPPSIFRLANIPRTRAWIFVAAPPWCSLAATNQHDEHKPYVASV